jgi:Fur family peroxide stress response transcriptional regulator
MKYIHNPSTQRITTQQQAILQHIKRADQHQTAEQVYKFVRKTLPRISLATVYRNLEKLASSSLISRVTINSTYYFELETQPHYHVLCQACGRLDNLEVPPATDIEEFFSRSTKYKLTGHQLILFGLCPSCQRKAH